VTHIKTHFTPSERAGLKYLAVELDNAATKAADRYRSDAVRDAAHAVSVMAGNIAACAETDKLFTVYLGMYVALPGFDVSDEAYAHVE
jgi:hypothetical protein